MLFSSARHQLSRQPTRLARDASARLAAASAAARHAPGDNPCAEGESGGTESCTDARPATAPPTTPESTINTNTNTSSAGGSRLSSSRRASMRSGVGMRAHDDVFCPLYDPSFMGSSSRFRMHRLPDGSTAVTRRMLTDLEKERLTHASPSTVNDHLCITMVKALRWLADRVFRERHMHRATMLKTVAAVPPTAAAVMTFFRLTGRSARESSTVSSSLVVPRAAVHDDVGGALSGSSARTIRRLTHTHDAASSHTADAKASTSAESQQGAAAGDRLAGLDTIRGLLAQSECHTAHHQILIRMAEITPFERFFVLFAQGVQFVIYALIFLVYPRMGFRLIGYTHEESSVVWTQMINDIDLGKIPDRRVPRLALEYWGLLGSFIPQGAPPPVVVVEPTDTDGSSAMPTRSPFGSAHVMSATTHGNQTARATTTPGATSSASSPDVHATAAASAHSLTADAAAGPSRPAGLLNYTDLTLTLRDVVLLIRSDEMYYRDACHKLADEIDRVSRERSRMPWGQRFVEWAEAWLKK